MLRVVLCNCSPEESDRLARRIVENGYAACVNVISGVRSHYEWNGEVCEETEDTLLIKTTDQTYADLEEWLAENHSYDVPEIVALEAERVFEPYLDWVEEQVAARE